MPIVTATEVTVYSNISASAGTITTSGLIPIVQERINHITNNWFTTDLYRNDTFTFNATARTITSVGGNSFDEVNFLAADEIYVYQSYRNDRYYEVSTVAGSVLTLVSGSAVVNELSGRSILISVVNWPNELKYTASQMVYYDYDLRKKRTAGVKSHSLGPFSESYSDMGETYGYPDEILAALYDFRIARVM